MNNFIKFLTAPAMMLLCMATALAEDVAPPTNVAPPTIMDDWAPLAEAPTEHATLGSCLAAIAVAQRHDNEWQETSFTPEECAIIGGKAIDGGMAVMANPTQENFNKMVKDIGIDPHANDLSTAPPVDLAPKIKAAAE